MDIEDACELELGLDLSDARWNEREVRMSV